MLGRLLLLVTSPAWLALGGLARDYFGTFIGKFQNRQDINSKRYKHRTYHIVTVPVL